MPFLKGAEKLREERTTEGKTTLHKTEGGCYVVSKEYKRETNAHVHPVMRRALGVAFGL